MLCTHPPLILWCFLLGTISFLEMLEVTVMSLLGDYMKLLVAESIFCSFTKTLEHDQFHFWQASQYSPFLETVVLSFLPSLSSHSFCSIVLFLSFHVSSFFFFFFSFPQMACYKTYAVSDLWSNVRNYLTELFHPQLWLLEGVLTKYSLTLKKWQFCWIFENTQKVFLHMACISISKIVTQLL